jgi:hypothetical protein
MYRVISTHWLRLEFFWDAFWAQKKLPKVACDEDGGFAMQCYFSFQVVGVNSKLYPVATATALHIKLNRIGQFYCKCCL